ncbi:MAG: DEAD/DEAH box helicase [Fimbriimonadaceae bacterium]|nr:DEAD/DEAH box helicase [Fimbriimonadaceae bacterium]QYK56064.1 MAG: DEAD/DEAH box helicase [Fimbriimonadaceae bacterium]
MPEPQNMGGFAALGLAPGLLTKLSRQGITTPTPIQAAAIPLVLEGRDVVGLAQTGTGKTFAFGLPLAMRSQKGCFALVLAPTRELAEQIEANLRKLDIRTAVLVGGASMNRQVSALRGRPEIVVATPGRLLDHVEQRTIDLRRVHAVVLDEADRMLDMGFAPTIKRILGMTPRERQTMLFSATMPRAIAELAAEFLINPARVEVAPAGTAAELVSQKLLMVLHPEKQAALGKILDDHTGTVLVFARTRHGARKLAKVVRGFGHSAAEIHSDRTPPQRRAALEGFKSGEHRILVATDIAARGIDVHEIGLVVNYDLPDNPEDYIHRIGRTGRAGATGKAITLATPEQKGGVRDIERLLGKAFDADHSAPRDPGHKGAAPFAQRSRRPQHASGVHAHRPRKRATVR